MRSAWLVAFGVLGCSSADETPPPSDVPPTRCAAGTWQREDGACIDAGLPPDLLCAPAEWLDDEGNCIPAGVPSDGCAEGFVHDGDRGCDPILPPAPCPAGLMAVPGEMACREVAPCAAGTWGDIPVETNTEHVDASYAGMDSDGSALKPWTSIQAGIDAAAPGAIVAIAAGSYQEALQIAAKPVRLWGACPADVEIVGVAGELAAVDVRGGANGTELHDLAIRGDAMGLLSSGSQDLGLERVWVHANGSRGVNVENALGATSVTLRGSLVEANDDVGFRVSGAEGIVERSVVRGTIDALGITAFGVNASLHSMTGTPSKLVLRTSVVEANEGVGVFVEGSEVTVEASVIRATALDAAGGGGRGIHASEYPGTGAPSALVVRESIVAGNREFGVFVESSQATLEAVVVRDTEPDAVGSMGRGVNIQTDDFTAAPADVVLRTSLLDRNCDIGIYVEGSRAAVESSVVRATQPRLDGHGGRGASVQAQVSTGSPSTFDVRGSLFEHNHEATLYVSSSNTTVEASVLRATEWSSPGIAGRGVNASSIGATHAPSTVVFKTSIIENHAELAVFAEGSEARVESSVIRATQPNALGFGGRAINVEPDPMTGALGKLSLYRSAVEQSQEAGVMVIDSDATLEASIIRDTSPSAAHGFGHGIVVVSDLAQATAHITGTRVERSALAGLAAWGALVVLGDSSFVCQAFDLNAETYLQRAAAFDDLEGNLCGCPEPNAPCRAASANLEPPTALDL